MILVQESKFYENILPLYAKIPAFYALNQPFPVQAWRFTA